MPCYIYKLPKMVAQISNILDKTPSYLRRFIIDNTFSLVKISPVSLSSVESREIKLNWVEFSWVQATTRNVSSGQFGSIYLKNFTMYIL